MCYNSASLDGKWLFIFRCNSSNKYYDKLIQEKKGVLGKLNSELEQKKQELYDYDDELSKKEKVLKEKNLEIKNINNIVHSKKSNSSKEKKYVQTSFFKPIVKKEKIVDEKVRALIDLIKEMDINSITPVDAMKKLIELKEKLKEQKL